MWYELIREVSQPLPSQHTLRRRIEHLKFYPGILEEVIMAMRSKINVMTNEERYCAILIDEMAINSKLDFDVSTDMVLGKPTLPSANRQLDEVATHGLVYMLVGVTTSCGVSIYR